MFKTPERQAEIEYIRKKQTQRIAKQQVIFISLFVLFMAGLIYYIVYKQYYLEFPGYVVNKEVDVLINYRKTILEYEEVSNQIKIKKDKIAELQKDIAKETHNIQLGISTNMYKLDLERQLREVQIDLQMQERVLGLLGKQLKDVNVALEKSGIEDPDIQMQHLTHLRKKDFNRDVLRFYVSSDSAIVTKMSAAKKSRVFRSEDIVYMQPLDVHLSNIYITAYVPFEDVKYCTYGTPAELVVSNEICLEAYVAVQGAESVELPPNLQSNFSRISLFGVCRREPL